MGLRLVRQAAYSCGTQIASVLYYIATNYGAWTTNRLTKELVVRGTATRGKHEDLVQRQECNTYNPDTVYKYAVSDKMQKMTSTEMAWVKLS